MASPTAGAPTPTAASAASRSVLNGFLVADCPHPINVIALNHEASFAPTFRLYVGTLDGRVLHYEGCMPLEKSVSIEEVPASPLLTPPSIRIAKRSPLGPPRSDSKPKSSSNFKEFERRMSKLISQRLISRQPVEAVCVLSAVKRVATMSSGQVLLLDQVSLDKIVKLSMPKGAFLLTRQIHPMPSPHNGARKIPSNKLAVATKSRVTLYEIREKPNPSQDDLSQAQSVNASRALSATLFKDIPISDPPCVIAWISDSILYGSVNQYCIISLKDGSSTPLFNIQNESSVLQMPHIHPFPESMHFCLLVEDIGLVITASGEPTGSTLPLKSKANAIAECYPYILTISNGVLDIFNRSTGTKLQSLFLSHGENLPPKYFLADDIDSSIVAVADKSQVWCLQKVSRDDRIKELLRKREYEEAIHFAAESSPNESPDAMESRVGQVKAQAAFLLLSELRFEDAMNYFSESSVFNPSELFPLFPRFSSKWTSQVPRKPYWGLHPPLQSLEEIVRFGFRDVKNTIVPTPPVPTPRRSTPRDFLQSSSSTVASPYSFPSFHSSSSSLPFPLVASSSLNPKPSQSYGASTQEALKIQMAEIEPYVMDAMYYISRYFVNARKKTLSKFELQGIDTLLIYLFIQLEDINELENFVSEENHSILEEVEDLLKESHLYKALALLFESKGLKEKAIEVWASLAKGDFVIADSPDSILEQALSASSGISNGISSMAAQNLTRLLCTILSPELVLYHLPWLLQFNPELVLTVLTSLDSRNTLNPKLLQFLFFLFYPQIFGGDI